MLPYPSNQDYSPEPANLAFTLPRSRNIVGRVLGGGGPYALFRLYIPISWTVFPKTCHEIIKLQVRRRQTVALPLANCQLASFRSHPARFVTEA